MNPRSIYRQGDHWSISFVSMTCFYSTEPVFSTFKEVKEARNQFPGIYFQGIDFQGIDSASLCRLAGRYDNPIPTRFLAPIDCSKIPVYWLCSPLSLSPHPRSRLTPIFLFSVKNDRGSRHVETIQVSDRYIINILCPEYTPYFIYKFYL
jgi:hypothetical protein